MLSPYPALALAVKFAIPCMTLTYQVVSIPYMAAAVISINRHTLKGRSPEIVARLTDHLWSITDLLTWRRFMTYYRTSK